LGFRAEDAAVSPSDASINAAVYTMELLGDATMIAVKAGGALVSVKANKDYRTEIGDHVSISVSPEICHLFDPSTGARIRA
jgi:multiple sugar transport system ATP-binding protein